MEKSTIFTFCCEGHIKTYTPIPSATNLRPLVRAAQRKKIERFGARSFFVEKIEDPWEDLVFPREVAGLLPTKTWSAFETSHVRGICLFQSNSSHVAFHMSRFTFQLALGR